MKKLIVFDLDGTLAESKSPLDAEMAALLTGLGIRKLRDTLGIAIEEMIFVSDAVFPGGNDYPAKEAGVLSIQVRDPEQAKRVIEAITACLNGVEQMELCEVESR